MSIFSEIEDALEEVRASMFDSDGDRHTFQWRGRTIPCVLSMSSESRVVVVGGQEIEANAIIYVLKSDLPAVTADMTTITVDSDMWSADNAQAVPPVAGQRAQALGRRYKILTAQESLAHWQLVCKGEFGK